MPGLPVHHQLPEFTQTHVHSFSDPIQPSHPLSSPLLPPSVFPSIRVFSNESVLHIRWPKYWSFSFGISPSNQYSGLISFRMDWLDLPAIQGTLKSLLQYHSSKALILWHLAFLMVQLSHPDFQENIYFCFSDYAKAFDCMDYNKLWKILKEAGMPSHLTCLLRNLYAGQETTVRTGHETMDWFQIGKGVRQGNVLSPCLFKLYAEYIMQNARLYET